MDPNANVAEQLSLAKAIQEEWDREDEPPNIEASAAARLAELVLALDNWLKGGGFPPEIWTSYPQWAQVQRTDQCGMLIAVARCKRLPGHSGEHRS